MGQRWARRDPLRADDGIRTRDPHLGKVMLYQLSHVRVPAACDAVRQRRLADPTDGSNSGPNYGCAAPEPLEPALGGLKVSIMRVTVNGELIDPAAPALSMLDHGFIVGDGVFETVKVVDNEPFALTRHLRRLAGSARGLGLPEPEPGDARAAIKVTLDAEKLPLGRMRITYTGGVSPLGSGRPAVIEPTLVVAVEPCLPPTPSTCAVTVPWRRNEHGALTGLKTTSYAENVVALAYAVERDATEAIFANTAGNLCEGTGSNVFCVLDGVVVTPPLASGCLDGITRQLVMEWYDVQERDLTMLELADADEVFLTSTPRDVQWVSILDGRELGGKAPITAAVAAQWAVRAAADIDP
jgi:branched-chain amino acid aminotransferase